MSYSVRVQYGDGRPPQNWKQTTVKKAFDAAKKARALPNVKDVQVVKT